MTTEQKNIINKEIKKIESNPIKRFFNSTPKYFKVLMGIGFTVLTAAISITQLPEDLKVNIPITILKYAETIAWIGGVIVFISAQTHDRDKTIEKLKGKYKLEDKEN